MPDEKKSLILAFLAVLFWSTVATAFKIGLRTVSPSLFLFYASTVSTLILLILILLQKRFYVLGKLSKKDILMSLLIGFLNPFLYYLVLFQAYSLLPAQEALSLNYTWAIVLTILSSVFQKKKIGIVSHFALFISFFGVLVIISKGSIISLKPSNSIGAILAIASSLVWGFSWIFNVLSNVKEEIRLFLNFAFGSIFSFLYLLLFDNPELPSAHSFIPIVYIGAFEMGITFLIWNKALKSASNPAKVNNLIYLSPFLSILFINFILKEPIHISTFVGLVLIVFGIVIQNITSFQALQNRNK
ncbi:MAG: DMT family transporter [Candidatus Kapaibacteriota bacterium]